MAKKERKVTVLLPEDLITKALQASGEGLTPTLRKGLELIAAKAAYQGLLKLKGKFDLGLNYVQVKKDRA
ncbi:hypothetical protein WDW37_20070 [Bdellovibrionota bacterium FG-1]